jgi:hypothetical protein
MRVGAVRCSRRLSATKLLHEAHLDMSSRDGPIVSGGSSLSCAGSSSITPGAGRLKSVVAILKSRRGGKDLADDRELRDSGALDGLEKIEPALAEIVDLSPSTAFPSLILP